MVPLFPRNGTPPRPTALQIAIDDLPHRELTGDGEYHDNTFATKLQELERKSAPNPDYLRIQRRMSAHTRATVIDWMIAVGASFSLRRDCVHLAIHLFDQYFSVQTEAFRTEKFQLIATAALFLSAKIEESTIPLATDFVESTNRAFSVKDLVDTERDIAAKLQWDLYSPTAYTFVSHYLQRLAVNSRKRVHARFGLIVRDENPNMLRILVPPHEIVRIMEFVDLATLDINFLCFLPSVIAASALMTFASVHPRMSTFTVEDVEQITMYSRLDLENCCEWLSFVLSLAPEPLKCLHQRLIAERTPRQEYCTIQQHHPVALSVFGESMARRNGARHPAAQRHIDASWEELDD